jgi:hypothetical protein
MQLARPVNQHDFELEEWKIKTAYELGISISELERKLLAAAQEQAIIKKGKVDADSKPNPV